MVNVKVLEETIRRLDEVLNEAEARLMTGQGVPDFATYRYSVGYVKGVVDAKAIIAEVVDAMTKE